MKVLFRCDGNPEIGAGHLVRCGALAREITKRGGQTALACREVPESLRWATAGVKTVLLGAGKQDEQLEAGAALGPADLELLLDAALRWWPDWIVVDHYDADGAYLLGVSQSAYRLAVFDDAGERDLRAARFVVNPNPEAEAIPYKLSGNAALCLGPDYAALRPEFAAAREILNGTNWERNLRRPAEKIFVSLGGSRLARMGKELVGVIAAWGTGLEVNLASGLDAAATAAAMSGSGLAVSASGSTVWELCCLGVPSVVWPVADNQRGIAAALHRAGAALAVDSVGEALAAARSLIGSPERRLQMGRAARKLVDGRGAARVADELEKLTAFEKAAKVPLPASDSIIGAAGIGR